MSDKGKQGGYGQDARPPATQDNPQIISGWEHSLYAHRNVERYAYLGKDETTGEPEWVDWGSKKANAEAAQKDGKK